MLVFIIQLIILLLVLFFAILAYLFLTVAINVWFWWLDLSTILLLLLVSWRSRVDPTWVSLGHCHICCACGRKSEIVIIHGLVHLLEHQLLLLQGFHSLMTPLKGDKRRVRAAILSLERGWARCWLRGLSLILLCDCFFKTSRWWSKSHLFHFSYNSSTSPVMSSLWSFLPILTSLKAFAPPCCWNVYLF